MRVLPNKAVIIGVMIRDIIKKETGVLILLAVVVLLSRFPFLNAGYGVEEDSWGIAVAAYHTHLYGIMEASRLPGHPVNEFVYSLFWGYGAWLYNLFSALCSVLAFLFFYLSLKKLGIENYRWGAIALAFTPVVYINSTCTVDYLWALMFSLASFYALIHHRFTFSAILLALAIGCRINSIILLPPFLGWIFGHTSSQKIKKIVLYCALTGAVSLLCYAPVIQVYGMGFFTYSDQFPYPSFLKIVYKATIGVWGLPATLTWIFLLFYILIKRAYKKAQPIDHFLFLSLVFMQLWSYLMLPQKSAYVMLIVPFGILWLGQVLNKKHFTAFCILVTLSSFFMSINLTDAYRGSQYSQWALKKTVNNQEIFFDILGSPIRNDYTKRIHKLKYTRAVLDKTAEINYPAVVICGWWFNQILIEQMETKERNRVKFAFYLSPQMLNYYQSIGYQIFYLSEQERFNDLYYAFNGTKSYANPFLFGDKK